MIQRLYLDSNVYDFLISPEGEQARADVLQLVRSGRWHVYGSLCTLEELGAVAGADPGRYERLRECFWGIVGTNVLLDRALLVERELRSSKRLSIVDACFPREFILSEVRPATQDLELLDSVAAEVRQRATERARTENAIYAQLQTDIAAAVHKFESGAPATQGEYADWLAHLRPQEIQPYIDNLRESRQFRPVPVSKAPVLAAWVAYLLARAKRNLRTSKAFERSAVLDHDHFAHAAVPGVLVTGDKDFAKSVETIRAPLVQVLTTDEMAAAASRAI